MKTFVQSALRQAIDAAISKGQLPQVAANTTIQVTPTKDRTHGDWATNLCLMLAKPCQKSPKQIAEIVCQHLDTADQIEKVEIAGPGFINFFMAPTSAYSMLDTIAQQMEKYGQSNRGKTQKIQVEFVSANPTGPLHIGHGRGAAYGDILANLLSCVGFNVTREYYVNDAGRQMDILAVSTWIRYLAALSVELPFPANGYQGDYVKTYAMQLVAKYGEKWRCEADELLSGLPKDEADGGDKELYIDAIIAKAKQILGAESYDTIHLAALNWTLDDIREDLSFMGIEFDEWFSEASLEQQIPKTLEKLSQSGYLYQDENSGNLWFRSTDFGDDKDRVVKRANGQTTYFASDIAYHDHKIARGFNPIINIWGADHHGYIPRVKAALEALDLPQEALEVELVQFANLYRDGVKVPMSTRSGQFITLRELAEEAGIDATRFFYVIRKADQHLDFDIDLAKSQSKDNPVYYIQYAHARIASLLRKSELVEGWQLTARNHLGELSDEAELSLAQLCGEYPDILWRAACAREPHQIANFLRALASGLHTYYNRVPVNQAPDGLKEARLYLLCGIQQVIRNGLAILGVSAPDTM